MKKHTPIFLAIFSFVISSAYGQSGSLDTSFGNLGLITTDVTPNRTDFLNVIVIQDDQKIIAAGTTQNLTSADFSIVRYLTDGTLDPDFGDGGISVIDFNTGDDRAYGLTIQPDGRILVCGHADVKGSIDFAVVRLNPDGHPDTTFGDFGKVTTDMVSSYVQANSVVVQEDGKIIVAGRVADGNFSNFAMVRYHSDGEIDDEFGTEGKVFTNILEEDEAKSAAVQPDGKIILAGFASVSAKGDFAMARYNPDGTPDKDFGTGGIVLTDLEGEGRSDFATSMVLQKNGQIILAGNANFNNLFIESDIGVVRYNADGSIDEDFAENGIFILALGNNTQAGSIVQTLDGKYIVGGKANLVFGQNMWLLARLQDNGALDPTFTGGGLVMQDFPGENEFITSIALQRDSRIVAGGLNGNSASFDFTLGRFISDFLIDVELITPIFCHGDSNAIFQVTVEGGVSPYHYSLDGINYSPLRIFPFNPAGEYTIYVKDANGVVGVYSPFIVTQPPPPPSVTVTVHENSIIISANGSDDLLYSIDGGLTFVQDSVFTLLPDGIYEVIVEDQNGCNLFKDEFNITFTGTTSAEKLPFTISPNPCREFIFVETENDFHNAELQISDLTGMIVEKRKISTSADPLKIDISRFPDGVYYLTIIDGISTGTKSFVVAR